jgi:hypothetical protein
MAVPMRVHDDLSSTFARGESFSAPKMAARRLEAVIAELAWEMNEWVASILQIPFRARRRPLESVITELSWWLDEWVVLAPWISNSGS